MRQLLAISTLVVAVAFAGSAHADELTIEPAGVAVGGTPVSLTVTRPDDAPVTSATLSAAGTSVEVELSGGREEITVDGLRLSAGRHTLVVEAADGGRAETPISVVPGWLSVVPPLLAIALALWFKDVLIALVLGVYSGALVLAGWNPFQAFARTGDHFVRDAVADADHASILVFTLLLGAMVGVITRSGGTLGVVERVSGFATSLRRGQLATWAMGLLVFFDDYANTLIVGPTMRPITDRLRISREKLAYLVDSTAAPVASLVPISTWVGYEVGLIGAALAGVGLDLNPYLVFVDTIPYRFYPLFALTMVFAVGYFGRDLGPMLKAERRALQSGEVVAKGDVALSDFSNPALEPPDGIDARARNAILPILSVLGVTLLGLYLTGATGIDPALSGVARWREILGNADSYAALIWASAAGLLVATVLGFLQPRVGLRPTMEALVEGLKSMLLALTVLVLAWSLGSVTSELHTADYIVGLTENVLSPHFVPMLVFVIGAAIAFATGTSWATMAILIPLVVPVIHRLAAAADIVPGTGAYQALLLGSISSVLAGSVWGDHCSPISDTTILSSMATGCDHIAHVRTQMPYALALGGLGMLLGDIPSAYGLSPWISLAVGVVVILVGVRLLGTRVDSAGA